jgi:hypothetical protein
VFAHSHAGTGRSAGSRVVATPKDRFKFAELRRLEPAARRETIPERIELQGGHRFENVQLADARLQDCADTSEGAQGAKRITRFKKALSPSEFPQDLLEPQFVHLVNCDEERFIVLVRLWLGELKEFVNLQILRVGQCFVAHVTGFPSSSTSL